MLHTVYVDLVNEVARAATSGNALPSVTLKLRRDETVAFAFMTSGTVAAVSGWVSGKCVIKERPLNDVLLLDTTLAVTGATTTTRYSAAWAAADCDSDALRTFLSNVTLPKECWCEVTWTDATGTHSVAFPILFAPTFLGTEDEAPDPAASASETWLDGRAIRFDKAQTLTTPEQTQALANIGISGIKSITKTAGGFIEIVDGDDNTFNWGLTAGSAPA